MPAVKEFREWFLRATKVTSGTKPDQESGFPVTYTVKGETVFNRFLANHFPSESVMRKFLESIGFKLNPEDKATTLLQGFVKKASDDNAEARTLNPATSDTTSVTTHQLPDVVLATDADDSVQSSAEAGGLKLSILRRAFAGGLKRKNFKLEVSLHANSSVIKQGAEERLQLANDALAPGNSKHYGTDAAGAKGWFADPVILWRSSIRLDTDFDAASNVPVPVTGGDQFRINIPAAGEYKFKAWMPVLLDNANGARLNVNYSAAVTSTRYRVKFLDTATLLYKYLAKKTAINGNDNWDLFTDGYIEVEGTILVAAAGILTIEFGTKNGLAGLSKVQAGSYFEAEQVLV